MEEQCTLRPESDSDDEVRTDANGEITVLPLTITPLGDVCEPECDHQDEFTRAADMLVEKLLKRTNEIYFQGLFIQKNVHLTLDLTNFDILTSGVCGNIFKVEAGRRKRKRATEGDQTSKEQRLEVEIDENGDPCGKFPCPLCKVVLFESFKLDEHLKTHMAKDTTGRCDFCHSSFPQQQLKLVEKSVRD